MSRNRCCTSKALSRTAPLPLGSSSIWSKTGCIAGRSLMMDSPGKSPCTSTAPLERSIFPPNRTNRNTSPCWTWWRKSYYSLKCSKPSCTCWFSAPNNERPHPRVQNHQSVPSTNVRNSNWYFQWSHSSFQAKAVPSSTVFIVFAIKCPKSSTSLFFILFLVSPIGTLLSSGKSFRFARSSRPFVTLLIGRCLRRWRLWVL